MTTELATMIVGGFAMYLGIGLLVAIVFVALFLPRLDYAGRGSGIFFRLIIVPGIMALWPIILIRIFSFRIINKPIPNHQGEDAQ